MQRKTKLDIRFFFSFEWDFNFHSMLELTNWLDISNLPCYNYECLIISNDTHEIKRINLNNFKAKHRCRFHIKRRNQNSCARFF